MSHEIEQADAPPPQAHEESDVNLRGLFAFVAALTVVMIGVNVGMWLLFGAFERRAAERDPPRPPLVDERRPPVGPHLQVAPAEDVVALRERQDQTLRELRWLDERARVVRIPVERAMEIVADRGLPDWPAPPELETAPRDEAGSEQRDGAAIEEGERGGEP